MVHKVKFSVISSLVDMLDKVTRVTRLPTYNSFDTKCQEVLADMSRDFQRDISQSIFTSSNGTRVQGHQLIKHIHNSGIPALFVALCFESDMTHPQTLMKQHADRSKCLLGNDQAQGSLKQSRHHQRQTCPTQVRGSGGRHQWV